MNDTPPEVAAFFQKLLMAKSGQERLEMGFSMFNMAREQVLASISRDHPDADEKEIRKRIFLRYYENDFSPEEQEKILKQIV